MTKLDPELVARKLGAWSAGRGRLHEQLADALVDLVERGEFRDGDALPAERALAATLAVSRGTIVRAYGALSDGGRVERRQGSGTVVRIQEMPGPAHGHRAKPLFDGSSSTALLKAMPKSHLDLRSELSELARSPFDQDPDLPPEGLWELRCAVAERLAAQGVPTGPDEVLITNGAQHACMISIQALCRPGDIVLTEALTWPGLTDLVTAIGARPYGIAMDADGVRTDELRAAVERLHPAAVVLNPHQHNPTGTSLTEGRRREVADIAGDHHVPVVEDRAYADTSFDGPAPPPLTAYRPDAPIIVVDSLSKTVWNGLRIGWIRASGDFIGRLRLVRAVHDLGTAIPTQLLALQLLPRFDELLAQQIDDLRRRADHAHEVVSELLPDWRIPPAAGGGSLWAEIPHGSARGLAAHAARSGLLVVADDTFAVDAAPDRFLRLPFTTDLAVFRSAVEHLSMVWSSYQAHAEPPEQAVRLVV